MRFEVDRWTGDGLFDSVAEEIHALYAWLAEVRLADVLPPDSGPVIAGLIEQLPATEATADLLSEVADAAGDALADVGLTLEDLFDRDEVLTFLATAGTLEPLRSRLITAATSSTAYRRLVAHVLYQGVKAYVLTENVFARKIPGASSLVRFGQRSVAAAAPGLEKAVDTQLSGFVEANIAETLRDSRRYLEATVDAAMIRTLALEGWTATARRPLADIRGAVSEDGLAEMADQGTALVRGLFASGRLTPVIAATLTDLLDRRSEDSPADLLSELGLTEEVLTGVAVEACSHLAAQSAVRDYVESRIRARLSAFYARP
ncbi:MAG: hypothetical protein GX344_05045 [Intrasporangiaceae bacterium]|nr:hypothetical protein [Intrasporangiaceae bacterium]